MSYDKWFIGVKCLIGDGRCFIDYDELVKLLRWASKTKYACESVTMIHIFASLFEEVMDYL